MQLAVLKASLRRIKRSLSLNDGLRKGPSSHEMETPRLWHRQIKFADRADFYQLLKDPVVIEHCFDPLSEEDMDYLFSSRLPPWGVNSKHWLCLAIKEKSTNHFVGVTGFVKSGHEAEVGFMFLPQFFGQGLATESLMALVERAQQLGIKKLTANITEGNFGSKRVVEKCGFSLSNTLVSSVSIGGKSYPTLVFEKVL